MTLTSRYVCTNIGPAVYHGISCGIHDDAYIADQTRRTQKNNTIFAHLAVVQQMHWWRWWPPKCRSISPQLIHIYIYVQGNRPYHPAEVPKLHAHPHIYIIMMMIVAHSVLWCLFCADKRSFYPHEQNHKL